MNKDLLVVNHQFLTGRDWWIEEAETQFILCVKENDKVYKESVEKEHISFAKEIAVSGEMKGVKLKEGLVSILITGIKAQILSDELESVILNKKNHNV